MKIEIDHMNIVTLYISIYIFRHYRVYIDIILINICQVEQICNNFDKYFIKNIMLEREREREREQCNMTQKLSFLR